MNNPLQTEFDQVSQVYLMLTGFFVNYSMQVIGAILILIAGYFVARAIIPVADSRAGKARV